MSNKLNVFTDGSCLNNGKKNSFGAIGIFFKDNDPDNLGQSINNDGNKVTNQTMELLACIKALQIISEKVKNGLEKSIIYIYTDSSYTINCVTKWYNNWEKNGWINTKNKPVENKDLIQLLHNLKSQFIVIFKHINSHQDEPADKNSDEYNLWYGNYMADKLAIDACREFAASQIAENDNNENNENENNENNGKKSKKLKKTKKLINSLLNV